tara:strand:+ start:51969 stop:53105 length:1137 start_codon:yes stop_codon:yes gene_type:complete
MSLIFPDDEASLVLGEGRLHALIIGVGEYDHLGLGVPKPSKLLSGLKPLTVTEPAARRLARWLEIDYNNADCPLGSIELLLAPAGEYTRKDGLSINVEKADMANIRAATARWFQRCDSSGTNVAFFYFAGHGISTAKGRFLLPGDFGNPDVLNTWINCIDAGELQFGMAKCNAQHQYFFFDACRDTPLSVLTKRNPQGDSLVGSADFSDAVELSAEYSAAAAGRQAFGRDGGETFFCEALIMCLDGMGASRLAGGRNWRVDAATLSYGLLSVIHTIAARENVPITCECRVQKPVPLHFPDTGRVMVKVCCNSDDMNNEADITLVQDSCVKTSPPGDPRPWIQPVTAGQVDISVKFNSFPAEFIRDLIDPPVYDLEFPL